MDRLGWGYNSLRAARDGTTAQRLTPVQASGVANIVGRRPWAESHGGF